MWHSGEDGWGGGSDGKVYMNIELVVSLTFFFFPQATPDADEPFICVLNNSEHYPEFSVSHAV